MNFATWAIRRPIPAIILFILFTIAGLLGFYVLPRQNMPDLQWPVIAINVTLAGASPTQVEAEMTRKLEGAMASIPGVRHINSTIDESRSITYLEFEFERNINEAMNDVREAVSRIRATLPKNMEEPVLTKFDTADTPIATYAISSEMLDEEALSQFVDNTLSRTLLGIKGMGKVSRLGGVKREVIIELDPDRLNGRRLSIADVLEQINQNQLELTGGRAEIGGAEQPLRVMSAAHTLDQIQAIPITLKNGHPLRLDQIATVRESVTEHSQLALLDGQFTVGFQVYRGRGFSDLSVGQSVNQTLEDILTHYPHIKVEKISDTVANTEAHYYASLSMLVEGALLAIVIVWLFLRDWRATLISASALPLSVIPTFSLLYVMNFSLNAISLLALSMVIGLLVDDAIVEIENIVRHLKLGKSPLQAATDAATEIGLAVIATTLALIAVFLPTAFMAGIIGKFFKQFGWTAAGAVFSSLIVARLLTPMMSAYLLKSHAPRPASSGKVMRWYQNFIRHCLIHRHITMISTLMFFIGSLLLIPLLPMAFMPAMDDGYTDIQVELEPGSTLSDTKAVIHQAYSSVKTIPEIKHIFTTIGSDPYSAGSRAPGSFKNATLLVALIPYKQRSRTQQIIEIELRERLKHIPGARFIVGGAYPGEKLEITLAGDSHQSLADTALNLVIALRNTFPALEGIRTSLSLLQPEIVVIPDRIRSAELGITPYAISQTLRLATVGDYEFALAKLQVTEQYMNIRVRLPQAIQKDRQNLGFLKVNGNNGLVSLSSIAEIKVNSGPTQIKRHDQNRIVKIEAELGQLLLGDVLKKMETIPAIHDLPMGISKIESGDAEQMTELFQGFGFAMLTGIICIYLVLAWLFEDFFQPFTILIALPLSIGGAFAALLLTKNSLSLPTLLGLVMLMGVATKNSILLVEYALTTMRTEGITQVEALLDACHKRAQPVIMTTLAMAAGMLPIALGFGVDSSFQSPLAITILGGLITSTFLSLIVVPVFFTYVAQLHQAVRRLFRH
jgi:multidrug efflux pump subunit AcrB